MDMGALDRYITGNYGEDQFPDECPGCEDDENAAHVFSCVHWEDTRDFDSLPGGADYEDDDEPYDDFPFEYEYDEGGWDEMIALWSRGVVTEQSGPKRFAVWASCPNSFGTVTPTSAS